MPCLQVIAVSGVTLDRVLCFAVTRVRGGLRKQIRNPYPLSAVIKTRATFLPDTVFLDKFTSSLNVQEETLVPASFARVETASTGYVARTVSYKHNARERHY